MVAERTTPSDVQERQWINRAQAGDKTAFEALVRRYQRFAIGIAFRMTGRLDWAEDIAQEAFIKVWLNLPKFRGDSLFRTWLARIVTNLTVDQLRKETRQEPLDEHWAAPSESLPAAALKRELADQVRQAILTLPPQCRAALVLREYQQLSYKEIADALEIPIGTVMSRLNYARGKLRQLLESERVSPAASGSRIVSNLKDE